MDGVVSTLMEIFEKIESGGDNWIILWDNNI